ncbi:patatin-like phospholipase family protein [Stakelama tenebrarum]|uniref:Alpha/beta hydrolase n=1 Tax=Stakelama tenebrarum TaxID=2711215 RepID=A0A6G6Y1J6_9SPHN|nr:patatin-like phospholipase family protein [Sphingosinithalassobacter tenebrarum]QIG78483.1 alpha/beta hydrolase [Sphingosinithalassobacter tenebrarum]
MAARFLSGLMLALALAGCASSWPDRVPHSVSDQAQAEVIPGEHVRYWADGGPADFELWRRRVLDARNQGEPIRLLAISGGSDKGAFAAGLLVGWSEAGTRPDFTIVTGVSTGALIAPFAFLGSDYDDALRALYTGITADDIYRQQVLSGLLGGASLLDNGPLADLIARHVTPDLLDAIAREYAAGRRLLVMTTNLDAQRGVVWDMGAIAASGYPRKLALFRQVLLASAAIPGAFPPVGISVRAGAKQFTELHVDGGVTSGFLALPRSVMDADEDAPAPRGAQITLLYNGRIAPHFEVTAPKTFDIMERALSAALTEADRRSVVELRRYAARNNYRLSVCAIGEDFPETDPDLFDQDFMRDLFAYGEKEAAADPSCLTRPVERRRLRAQED